MLILYTLLLFSYFLLLLLFLYLNKELKELKKIKQQIEEQKRKDFERYVSLKDSFDDKIFDIEKYLKEYLSPYTFNEEEKMILYLSKVNTKEAKKCLNTFLDKKKLVKNIFLTSPRTL